MHLIIISTRNSKQLHNTLQTLQQYARSARGSCDVASIAAAAAAASSARVTQGIHEDPELKRT